MGGDSMNEGRVADASGLARSDGRPAEISVSHFSSPLQAEEIAAAVGLIVRRRRSAELATPPGPEERRLAMAVMFKFLVARVRSRPHAILLPGRLAVTLPQSRPALFVLGARGLNDSNRGPKLRYHGFAGVWT